MVAAVVASVAAGALTWTLLEYCIHRWLGHDPRLAPNLFGTEHTRHHAEGNYFAAFSRKLALAAIVMGTLTPLAIWVAAPATGASWAAGVVGAYLVYERTHLSAHIHPPSGRYSAWVRRHHFWHHFVSPGHNHGVTSPLWDVVFGTLQRPDRAIAVPRRLAMRWLIDAQTGELRAEHAAHYRLRGPAVRDPSLTESALADARADGAPDAR